MRASAQSGILQNEAVLCVVRAAVMWAARLQFTSELTMSELNKLTKTFF